MYCQSWSDIRHRNQSVSGNKLEQRQHVHQAKMQILNALDKMRERRLWTNINLHKSSAFRFADFVRWKKMRMTMKPCFLFMSSFWSKVKINQLFERCYTQLRHKRLYPPWEPQPMVMKAPGGFHQSPLPSYFLQSHPLDLFSPLRLPQCYWQ